MARTLREVGIKALKDEASAIVESVQRTRKPVVITKHGRGVARILPYETDDTRGGGQKLLELGLISAPARLPWKTLELEPLAGAAGDRAVRALLSERGED